MNATMKLVTAAALVALASSAAQAQTKIRLGFTPSNEFAGAYLAKEQGFFAKRGLDVEMQLVPLNSSFPPALASGSMEIGGATPPLVLQANDGGLDLVIVAGGGVNDPTIPSVGVIARNEAGIKDAQGFVGKIVGAPGLNATLHILFRRWLMERGVDYKKVRFVETAFPQMAELLKSGTVDAVLVPEPFFSRIIEAKAGYMVASYVNELGYGIASVFYAATRQWTNANAKAAKAVQDAIAEAEQFSVGHPDETRAAIGVYIKLPPPVLATIKLPKLQAKVTEAQVDYFAQTLVDQDMIKTKPDAKKIIWMAPN